jgi:hypothetical protein
VFQSCSVVHYVVDKHMGVRNRIVVQIEAHVGLS